MNPEDSAIYPFYQDYVQWCHENGIHPECWEAFYNECGKWPTTRLPEMQRWNEDLAHRNEFKARRSHPAAETIKGAKIDFQPIQPNDEERAVAEAIRILGGK